MIDLHKVERSILCELDCNSRQSLTSIGKKARLKKESVHYRIDQLEKKNIILGYPAIISLAKRGKIHAELFIQLHNVTVPLKNEIIQFFKEQTKIIDLASCKGTWDLLIGIVINDINELNQFKNKIYDKYSPYFANSRLSLTIETYFFGRKYLVGKNIHQTLHIDKKGNETTDELDEKILSQIAKNSRQNLVAISKKVKSTQKIIAYRLKKMKNSNIIQKYTLALNLKKMGLMTYKLLIRLKNSQHKNRIIEYSHKQKNIVNTREVLSDWNLELTFEVKSQEQLHTIINEIDTLFGESITTHTTLMLDQIHKTNYYS